MAGQRKNPTTGAVTVLKPTNRQTPKRAGGAVVNNPRKSGTPVGSGSRVPHLEQNPHCVESCETLFLKADRRGSHASGSPQERRVAIIAHALAPYRAIACFGSSPASGGPPLGGRAGERVARMLLAFCPFVPFRFCTFPIGFLLVGQ